MRWSSDGPAEEVTSSIEESKNQLVAALRYRSSGFRVGVTCVDVLRRSSGMVVDLVVVAGEGR
jgi:hypothetical protein